MKKGIDPTRRVTLQDAPCQAERDAAEPAGARLVDRSDVLVSPGNGRIARADRVVDAQATVSGSVGRGPNCDTR